jgi:IS5 family transposase
MGHTLSDNRHGLIASAVVTLADGYAEREAAKVMIDDARQALGDPTREITLGADKGYDAAEFIEACKAMKVTPHVAQNKSGRQSAVPESIAQSAGYAVSQQKRKLIEQGFGWAKSIGGMRQVMVRGLKKVDQMFVLTMAVYNLVRMRTLGEIRALQPL